MLQFRGLGAIPITKLGVYTGPQVVAPSSPEVPPLSPASYGGFVPTQGGAGTGAGSLMDKLKRAFAAAPSTAFMPDAISPPFSPGMIIDPGPALPPQPTPPQPIAANPANPMEPAPAGMQVTTSAPSSFAAMTAGKGGWIALGLGIVALGAALIAGHAHTHH